MIKLEDVCVTYDGKAALDKLSLNINGNGICALIGNNGSGKTTTINVICGLVKIDAGAINVFNTEVQKKGDFLYKKSLGVMLSTSILVEEFNIVEYWSFVAKFQGVPSQDIKQRITDLLELLNIREYSKNTIKSLSSGLRMKVSFGAALIHNPPILILDEPFINLDIQSISLFSDILKSFRDSKSILITSHNLELVIDLADTFLIIEDGKIILELEKSNNEMFIKEEIIKALVQKPNSVRADWLT